MFDAAHSHETIPASEAAWHATGQPHRQQGDVHERLEMLDALLRFAVGQDLKDERLFASAFAEDCELDFTQPAARLGVTLPVFSGRTRIVETIMATVRGLDTTHTVSNPRAWVDGDAASLFALVEAQHLPHGDPSRHLLLKNFYRVRLARSSAGWAMTRVRIDNVWMSGDGRVLFPQQLPHGTRASASSARTDP